MSHPTFCCSVSLDRCDLLVDLEGFHLVSVARRECGLVLDIESCDRCAGGPCCGVIDLGRGLDVYENFSWSSPFDLRITLPHLRRTKEITINVSREDPADA